mgnify:CR=1 FL=1
MSIRQEYINERPHEAFTYLKLDIPCDDLCLKGTKYEELLKDQRFAEALEVIRYMKILIDQKAKDLLELIGYRIEQIRDKVNLEDWAFSVYWKLQGKGEITVGNALYYDNIKLFEGDFGEVLKAEEAFRRLLSDPEVRELCEEIRNLSDSLWTHFEKNVKRALNEAENRS